LTFKGTVYEGRDPWRDHPAPKPVTVAAEELAKHRLFAGVPYAFLKWNEGAVGRLKCSAPSVLCRRGEFGATAFVIENGEIELLVGPEEELAGVKTRADLILGEMACLANQERTATLRARAGAEVLVVRRNMLHMLQRNKAAREELYPRYRERAIDAYLRRGRLFRGLSDAQNERCAVFLRGRSHGVTFLQADPGQLIVRQGEPADAFCIIYRGNVSVSERSPSGVDTVLDYLGTGRHFGEIGLMTALDPALAALAPAGRAGVRTASCTALDHVELVCIDRDAFAALLDAEPVIRAVFRDECIKILAKNVSTRVRLDHDLDEFTQDGLHQGQNLLVLDLEKCTRCQECVKACSDSHQGTTRLILTGKQFDRWLVPSACRSCFDPACLNGCPVDAIHRKPTKGQRGGSKSLAIVIEDHCIGCGLCEYNCPFGSIHMQDQHTKPELADKRLATNCDLCESLDGKPRCVYGCPHDAAVRLTGLEFAHKIGMHPLGPLID
jgi:Fe-S-cluster-containing hydrogenase component 2/CRP-like cAMP-binding protein